MTRQCRRSPFDPDTEYRLEKSETPVSDDGYKLGEPKRLVCADCGAVVLLTEEPSAGIDDLPHDPDCEQRWARSEWWLARLSQRR